MTGFMCAENATLSSPAESTTELPQIPCLEIAGIEKTLLHRARGMYQADLYALEWRGQSAVLKDLSGRLWLARVLWSRLVLTRELKVLCLAAQLGLAPRPLARVGRDAFLMERLDGHCLAKLRDVVPPLQFFNLLGGALRKMHSSGLAHGDLRRGNIFVTSSGRPYLLDFASGMIYQSGWQCWLQRFVHNRCVVIDRCSFARLKSAYYPDALTEEEAAAKANPPWYWSLGKILRRTVSRIQRPCRYGFFRPARLNRNA